jgi:hypothetical protein
MLKTSHALRHKIMANEIPHWVCAVSNCDIAINFELSINFELPLQKKLPSGSLLKVTARINFLTFKSVLKC